MSIARVLLIREAPDVFALELRPVNEDLLREVQDNGHGNFFRRAFGSRVKVRLTAAP